MSQSEAELEELLLNDLEDLGYDRAQINNETLLLANLKTQLSKHNNIDYSEQEFQKILSFLDKGNIYHRAELLRDKMPLERDDGTMTYVEFFRMDQWCQNNYQVTNQVSVEGRYLNRYDVTILVNGLPLCQIELKRRGMELKEAFNQIDRYQKHSYFAAHGLFQYVQLFVISNGENSKYFANGDKRLSFDHTCYWADESNQVIHQLSAFTNAFLEPCHLLKMIAKYMVLTTEQDLMVLRPYQYYAVEKIVNRVKDSDKNGYIWHTTGSGKTLTSFKASQLISQMKEIDKVLFVVDRKDLDVQTQREFNKFREGSVDGTNNTKMLVTQLAEPDTKLIVTTLQKLNNAINNNRYKAKMAYLKDQKVVFIFDECHRSQFGDTHRAIKKFFSRHQMVGFTGTPILQENAANQSMAQTTKDLFDECLHKYVINDAIRDKNVLSFSVDYVAKFTAHETLTDVKVTDIDTNALFESAQWISEVTDYIIKNHDIKTHSRQFNAIFCTSSVSSCYRYYQAFKRHAELGAHDLKVATVFSFEANEQPDDESYGTEVIEPHSRDKLEECISDYNGLFGTKFSTNEFEAYNKDLAKRVKNKIYREIDILIVVNMYLTGFDSPYTNTLYVDKNLKYHGLIQAFSRTNRLCSSLKSHGNIVCFRALKEATDKAIALFANKEAQDTILMKSYDTYLADFTDALAMVKAIVATPDEVHQLASESDQFEFIRSFRKLLQVLTILRSFIEFDFETLTIDEAELIGYTTQYIDLQRAVKQSHDKASILKDVDFQLELLVQDVINVDYILWLLYQNKQEQADKASEQQKQERQKAQTYLETDPILRSKKDLILKFIEKQNVYADPYEMNQNYQQFMIGEEQQEFRSLAYQHSLNLENLMTAIYTFNYKGYFDKEELKAALPEDLKFKERMDLLKLLEEKIKALLMKFRS